MMAMANKVFLTSIVLIAHGLVAAASMVQNVKNSARDNIAKPH